MWGLGIYVIMKPIKINDSAVSLASSYGGYSALEKAVHKAYYKKKGIKVYYKIHKSVMSMNKVRYVVG